MKQQTCWTILRYFQYDDKLQIKESYLIDENITDEQLTICKSVELTRDIVNYLERLFNAFKNQNTNKLEEAGIERIFATTDKGIPWKVKFETQYDQGITFENWLGLWLKYFNLNPREAHKSLVYTGFCGKMKDLVILHMDKLSNLLKLSKRKVFNVFVIGH